MVAVVVGAAFGIEALVKKSASNDGPCNAADYCTAKGLALRADAMHAGIVSTATLFAGAAATASGIALFFTAPAPFDRVPVSVGLAAGPGSVRLTGRW